jgi:putative flavoprotein involved in K+ transport
VTINLETVIIGAGQAGLALSYCLAQRGRPHVVLEQAAQVASAWRSRWDNFTLVTPNWAIRLPGAHYAGPDPDGFMPRDEVVAYLEQYAAQASLPIQLNTRVTAVEPAVMGGYQVITDNGEWLAHNVVVASGLFQRPRLPAFSAGLPAGVAQLHTSQYRRSAGLPPGAVLVIGSGQSGCQIAEELNGSGRTVYLSLGSTGRAPRRYRGRDLFDWLNDMGYFDRTPDKLSSPQARFVSNPQVSGQGGGHDLNPHQFARDGLRLLGHAQGCRDGRLSLAPDLHERLAANDKFDAELVKGIDNFIAANGLDAPPEARPVLRDGFDVPLQTELDLAAAGIGSVIWATGYAYDFSLVRLPIFEPNGYPLQTRGVTDQPGLYFLGMPWLHKPKSGLLLGVGEDAEYLADHLEARAKTYAV